MYKIIEVDENVIGYKDDLIKYLEEETKRLRKDDTIDNEELESILNDTNEALRELEKQNNIYLLALCPHPMGGFTIKQAAIEIE